MNFFRYFLAVTITFCISTFAAAQSVSILNNDGTITASGGNDLTLTGSTLAGISGLGMGWDCPPPACSGTVSFTTGHSMLSGGSLIGNATFTGVGSSFTVTSSSGPDGGFTFTGTFSKATWTKSGTGATAFWTFVGTVMNGTLKSNDGTILLTNINGATIDLTTLGGPTVNSAGFRQWTDAGGTTSFPSPVPEPGTLTLLGSGLVGLGVLARRRRTKEKSS